MKKLLVSFALAAASLSTAQAATINIGTLTEGSSFSAGSTLVGTGSSDLFTFFLDGSGSLASQGLTTFFSFAYPFSTTPVTFDGIFTSISLLDGLTGTTVATGTLADGGKSFTLSAANLSTGNYALSITGNATGNSGSGAYAIAGTVSPVPEPESYAMMLAGLAVMGAIARKRSQNKA